MAGRPPLYGGPRAPAAAGAGPAAAAYLAAPAAGPLPPAAGAVAEGEYVGSLPNSPRVGPAGYIGARDYPRNAAGERPIPPGSLLRLRAAGDKGALAYFDGQRDPPATTLTGDLQTNLEEVFSGMKTSRDHYAEEAGRPVPPPFGMREIRGILDGNPVPQDLRAPHPVLGVDEYPSDPHQWTCDYALYTAEIGGDRVVTIFKRFHVEGRNPGSGVYVTVELILFRLHAGNIYMITDVQKNELVPPALYGGRRRRRTRRITKASRYLRSGTRSRVHRRVRG